MGRKRREFSSSFKANVALAAAIGDATLAELASKHGVYPNQICAWKKQLLVGAAGLFEDGRKRKAARTPRRCTSRLAVLMDLSTAMRFNAAKAIPKEQKAKKNGTACGNCNRTRRQPAEGQ
jgi:transposase-like protein